MVKIKLMFCLLLDIFILSLIINVLLERPSSFILFRGVRNKIVDF